MDLSHHFLIAMPQMQDRCFRDTVIYILDHGDNGAFGVIINDTLEMTLESLLAQVDIQLMHEQARYTPVLRGGPVDPGHGLVLHRPGPNFSATRHFAHDVTLSSSKDVLSAIACGEEPQSFLLILGHAGWAPGQLEMEITDNAWLTCEANSDILFHTPVQERRHAVANLIGIDMRAVASHSGHA